MVRESREDRAPQAAPPAEERSGYVKLCEVQPRSLRFDEVLEFFFGTRVMVDLSKRQFLHFALANLQN
jgi:hypothetical protein